jgi:hypothetical protein
VFTCTNKNSYKLNSNKHTEFKATKIALIPLLGNHEVDFKTLLKTISRAEKSLCLDHLEQQESCVYLLKRRGV